MATDFQMRQIFQKKFYDVIAPKLRQYDGERFKKLAKVKKINTWLFAIAGVVFLFTVFLSVIFSMPIFQLGFVSIIMCIATLAVKSIISKNFENKMKAIIMPAVCSIFGDLKWYGGAYNYEGIFRESKLLVRYTSSTFDDIFKGKINGVNIEIIESKFTYESGSGKNRRTITEFDGVIVKFDMNKNFKGNTVIMPKSDYRKRKNLTKTELEDVTFAKEYNVFTDDEVEARYLITPSFMERVNNIKKVFKANEIRCAFWGEYLLLGLHCSKDLFSICSLDKPLDDIDQFYEMFEEIASIVKLIKYFKLNEKTGL